MEQLSKTTPEQHQQAVEAVQRAVRDHLRDCPQCGTAPASYCHHGWNLYYSARMLAGEG